MRKALHGRMSVAADVAWILDPTDSSAAVANGDGMTWSVSGVAIGWADVCRASRCAHAAREKSGPHVTALDLARLPGGIFLA